jgi:hypothetical protein
LDCSYKVIETNVREFEFDHVHGRGEKINTIANMAGQGVCIEKLDAEMAKCDLVCFGCHKNRTAKRLNEQKHQTWITVTANQLVQDLLDTVVKSF